MTVEDYDEYGIPVKKKPQSQPKVDEYGIPIKKKEDTAALDTLLKVGSDVSRISKEAGTLSGSGPPSKEDLFNPDISVYNKQFEENTGYKDFSLSEPQKATNILEQDRYDKKKKQFEESKYEKYRAVEETEINPVITNVVAGTVQPNELSTLYNKPYGKKIVSQIIQEQVPEVSSSALDEDVFGNEKKWDAIAGAIQDKNRGQGKAAQFNYEQSLIQEINGIIKNGKLGKELGAAERRHGGGVNEYSFDDVDTNNSEGLSKVLQQLEDADYVKGGNREDLIKKVQTRLLFLKAGQAIPEEITSLSDKIHTAVSKVKSAGWRKQTGLSREQVQQYEQRDNAYVGEALNYLRDANHAQYKNITRAIEAAGTIADQDYEMLMNIGKQISNQRDFDAWRYVKDDDRDFSTYQTRRANLSGEASELLKEMGYKNIARIPDKAAVEAFVKLGVDPNGEEALALRRDEAAGGHGFVKGGGLTAAMRGVASPIKAIQQSFSVGDPVSAYLNSRRFDYGDQKIPDAEGNYSDVLPSEKKLDKWGNVFNKASEGFGQFVTQVFLARGVGKVIEAPYNLAAKFVPRAALTSAQSTNIAAYAGGGISTLAQTYGHSFIDFLNKTGDPNKASFMALIDGVGQSILEVGIMPDVKIAESMKAALKSKRDDLAKGIIGVVEKGGKSEAVKPLITEWLQQSAKILGKEVFLEENLQNWVNYFDEALFSPETARKRDVSAETNQVIKEAGVQMLLPALFGGLGAAKGGQSQKITKDALNSGAINFDEYKQSLDLSLASGNTSQPDYNKAISILQTHRQSIENAPKEDIEGNEVSLPNQLDYAFNNTRLKILNQELEKADGTIQQKLINKKIKDIEKEQEAIVMPDKKQEKDQVVDSDSPPRETLRETAPEQVILEAAKGDKLGVYSTMVTEDPTQAIVVLKDLAQQIYRIDDKGEKLPGGSQEAALSKNFSNDVVEAAKQAFPTPESTLTTPTPSMEGESIKINLPEKEKANLDTVFKQEPAIADIGTPKEYYQYLKTVFPNSTVNGKIFFHRGNEKISDFDKSKLKPEEDAFYFKDNIKSEGYGKETTSAILNITKASKNYPHENKEQGIDKDADASIIRLYEKDSDVDPTLKEQGRTADDITEYGVYSPEQIHILGSKKDIEGFKKWKSDQPKQTPVEGTQDLAASEKGVTLGENEGQVQNIASKENKGTADTTRIFPKEGEENLSKRYKRVTDQSDFIDPYDRAVKYFADNGKINPSELERIFGGKGDKGARISLMKNDAGTVKQIAHHLWETDPSGKYEDTHYIDAVESALRNFPSKSAMQKDLADRYDLEGAYENYMEQTNGKEVVEMAEKLTEEEIDNILQLESEAKSAEEIDQYIDTVIQSKNETNPKGHTQYKQGNLPAEEGQPTTTTTPETGKAATGEEKVSAKTGDAGQPPITPATKKEGDEEFANKPKAILNRINDSEKVSETFKDKFKNDPKGLRYNPQSHETARTVANQIVDEFGEADAVAMAEAGRFDGDVNSLIFAEAIDRTFKNEQAAKTQEEKIEFAEQWADFAIRYDETAREKGRFISAIYDFYKKSPLGVIISERAKRDEAFKEWFTKREKPYKEVFEAIKDEPEFKEMVTEKVTEELKKERAETRQKRRAKITEIFDKAKIKGDQLSSSIIPPQIWNAAVEVMKQAALAGESIATIIQKGVDYIKTNHADAWDEKAFRYEWGEKLAGMDGKNVKTDEESLNKKQERILERFRKRLTGLSDQQKEDIIRKSFKQLVENKALEYDDFKKIIADVMGLGELTPEEVTKLSGFINDINSVQDAADNVMAQTEDKKIKDAIKNFDVTTKKAERSATKLSDIIYNRVDLGQRTRSLIQLNTLGLASLIKNIGYNVFNQIFVRIPKAIFGTAIDQSIYGLSFLSNKIFGSPIVKPDVNIRLAQKGYFNKGAEGTKQAVSQLFTGLTNKDYFQKEIHTSKIKPWTSIKDLWNWGRGKKHLSKVQIADKVLQATVGVPAEIIARGLNIGDKPFRFASEGATATTIGRQEFGLKGVQLDRFIRFPKEVSKQIYKNRGVPEETAIKKSEGIEKRIISEGEAAVFQQENIINDLINSLKKSLTPKEGSNPLSSTRGEIFKMVGLLNLPYVKTPVNIMWEFFNLMNPELALMQSFVYGIKAARTGSKEDFVKSKKWLAHAATGYSILAATAYIASIGALSGDDEDEAYKAKESRGKGTYEKPHSVNLSMLWRAGLSEDVEDEGGDLKVDLSWWGPLGSVMNFQANKYENMTEAERKDMSYIDDLLSRMESGARDGLVNTTFRGAFDAVNALTSGRTDGWVINMMNIATNLVEPATIAQISRANRKYEYQVKGDNFSEKLQNNLRARFFGKVKPKVNIWGEKMEKGNPVLSMLGISTTNEDVTAPQIHKDFKKTGNPKFYPPAISGTMSVDGEEVKLNNEQQLQMETLVGKARSSIVDPFANDQARYKGKLYSDLDEEEKVEALEKLYSDGYDFGKIQFIELYPEFRSSKKKQK